MSMELAEIVYPTTQILAGDPTVALVMGQSVGEVHGGKIPDRLIADMPQRVIVVKDAGGGGEAPGSNDTIPWSVQRIDVHSYGRTPQEAKLISTAVKYALKTFRRGVQDRVLISGFQLSAGPVAWDDPDGDWPVSSVSFRVSYADVLVPIGG